MPYVLTTVALLDPSACTFAGCQVDVEGPLLDMQAAEVKHDYRDRGATGAIFIASGRRSARLARESRWAKLCCHRTILLPP